MIVPHCQYLNSQVRGVVISSAHVRAYFPPIQLQRLSLYSLVGISRLFSSDPCRETMSILTNLVLSRHFSALQQANINALANPPSNTYYCSTRFANLKTKPLYRIRTLSNKIVVPARQCEELLFATRRSSHVYQRAEPSTESFCHIALIDLIHDNLQSRNRL